MEEGAPAMARSTKRRCPRVVPEWTRARRAVRRGRDCRVRRPRAAYREMRGVSQANSVSRKPGANSFFSLVYSLTLPVVAAW